MKKKPFKILILDDDPMYGKIIRHILEDIDYDIQLILSNNGNDALKKVNEEEPDLILTDWDMPEMSGIEFCKKVHNDSGFEHIPVIMCTGIRTSSGNLKTAFEAGVVDFIRKPIDKMEFLSRVNSMLKLSESYKTIRDQKEELQKEKEKTDKLLKTILPREIANDLKKYGRTEPKIYDNVTIFISDIVDFTATAAKINPHVLMSELNDMIQELDVIMDKHNCERIKTVGDAYVAVCGMPLKDKDHAEKIIKAALETIEYLEERNKTNKIKWQVRIGIDTGQIIGGIIGSKKYIYDIFGDPINMASRLESSSEPMRIHISEATYNLVKDKFYFEEQAPVEIKGKGKIKMYFVKSPR